MGRAEAFRVDTNPPKKEGRLQAFYTDILALSGKSQQTKDTKAARAANKLPLRTGEAARVRTLRGLEMRAVLGLPMTFTS